MPDPRNPHNSYYYKPLDQAAPIYIPPSHSTQRILPVPQQTGQGAYHYGMPGQASPNYIPPSPSAGKRMAKISERQPGMNAGNPYLNSSAGMGPYGYAALGGGMLPAHQTPSMVQAQPMRGAPQRPADAPHSPSKQGGIMGALGGLGGAGMGAMLSDERSKTEITRLKAKNDALTAALDGAHTGSNLPPTEYPSLPQNTRLPVGHANFADTPAANTVAAQNVGMAAPAAAQGATPLVPTPGVPTQRAVMPQWGAPNLSALDEAYRNMGQQGG